MKLQGKTALVTGGGTGIGEAIALSLASEGCRVAIGGRRIEKLRDVAGRSKSGPPILIHPVDVAERARASKSWFAGPRPSWARSISWSTAPA